MPLARSLIVGGLVVASAVTTTSVLRAAGSEPNRSARSGPELTETGLVTPVAVGPTLQLVSARVSQSTDDIVVTRKQVLEPQAVSVECPGPTTCTLVAEQHVQLSDGTKTGNQWAVCSHIDGEPMSEPLCPYLGEVPDDGSFDSGSYVQSMSGILPGVHKMRSFVYAKRTATVNGYAIVYEVYSEG